MPDPEHEINLTPNPNLLMAIKTESVPELLAKASRGWSAGNRAYESMAWAVLGVWFVELQRICLEGERRSASQVPTRAAEGLLEVQRLNLQTLVVLFLLFFRPLKLTGLHNCLVGLKHVAGADNLLTPCTSGTAAFYADLANLRQVLVLAESYAGNSVLRNCFALVQTASLA